MLFNQDNLVSTKMLLSKRALGLPNVYQDDEYRVFDNDGEIKER